MGTIEPSARRAETAAGSRVPLVADETAFGSDASGAFGKLARYCEQIEQTAEVVEAVFSDKQFKLGHGAVVIAAITSCTNTSNPST